MRLFVDPSEPNLDAIVEIGVLLLLVSAAFQIVDAMQVAALGLLRGIKDTTVPMILAVFSYWIVGMPSAYILGFPLGYGAQGVWGGLVIGLTVAAITMIWRYLKLQRNLDFSAA